MSEIATAIKLPMSMMKDSYQAGSYREVIQHGRVIIRLVGINQNNGQINDQEAEHLLDTVFQTFRGDPKIWQAWWKQLKSDSAQEKKEAVARGLISARVLGVSGPEGIPSVNPVLEQIAAKYGLPTNPDIKAIMHPEYKPNPAWKGTSEATKPPLTPQDMDRVHGAITQFGREGAVQIYRQLAESDDPERKKAGEEMLRLLNAADTTGHEATE